MNDIVENDFFGFPKVKWLHLIREVDKSEILSGFNLPKTLNSITF